MASLRVVPSRSILRGATKLQRRAPVRFLARIRLHRKMLARNVHHPVSFLASRGYEGCFTCHTRDKMAAHQLRCNNIPVSSSYRIGSLKPQGRLLRGYVTISRRRYQPRRRRTITPHLLCLVKLRHPPMVVRMYPSCQYTQIRRIRPVHPSRRGG